MLAPILPRPIIPSCMRGVFGVMILGAAHLGSNKIQRKDLSAALDPSDPVRFAEGLGLPPLAKFRRSPTPQRRRQEDRASHQSDGELPWRCARKFEGRRGRRAPALFIDRDDPQEPDLSGREVLEPCNGHAVFFGKLDIAQVSPDQLWRISIAISNRCCWITQVTGSGEGFSQPISKTRLLALSTLISVTGGIALNC